MNANKLIRANRIWIDSDTGEFHRAVRTFYPDQITGLQQYVQGKLSEKTTKPLVWIEFKYQGAMVFEIEYRQIESLWNDYKNSLMATFTN